jgi:hypothetical protein
MTEESGVWEVLNMDQDYEIYSEYPYPVRRRGKDKCITVWVANHGYHCVGLNGKEKLLHRVIATQFIPNQDPGKNIIVHHKNGNQLDNRIENLEWTTHHVNNLGKNKRKYKHQPYEYIDELPDNVVEINEYNEYEFEDVYFDIDNPRILKLQNSGKYKVIKPTLKRSHLQINLLDITKKPRSISYNKFIRMIQEALEE